LEKDESISVDGRLDEPAWQRTQPATDFRQQDPVNGAPATERTEVRVMFDRDRLFMGVICYDSTPDGIIGNQMQRDQPITSDDRFMWTFDTHLDGRTGYFFEVNPAGAMGDGLLPGTGGGLLGGNVNKDWDGIWMARVRRSETGWTVEVEIPFRTLGFDPGLPGWGANFQRTIRRKDEEVLWTGYARNEGLRRMSNAGLLAGITDVSQGFGLDVTPYIVADYTEAPGRGLPVKKDATGGVDFFYNITPQLKANLTVNTDFAETEIDQRRVNLTRFPLFFPEKREFFLDGATLFDFAREPDNSVMPFFSRRIGLDDNGRPQRIDAGIKLTGQIGLHDIGFFQARTASSPDVRGEDFTVLRAKRRFLRQSYAGVLYTRRDRRDAAAESTSHTFGADFLLATSQFRGRQNVEFSGFYVQNSDVLRRDDNAAFGFRLDYPNDRWSGSLSYRELQKNYNPAVGFVQRNGYRRWNPVWGFFPRPNQHPWIRQFSFQSALEVISDSGSNQLLTRKIELTLFRMETHSGESIAFQAEPATEYLDQDFRISRGITLPRGNRYNFTRYVVQARTANRRMFAVTSQLGLGTFYSGRRREFTTELGIRPSRGMVAITNVEWNRVELPEGNFSISLIRTVVRKQFNPWVSLANHLQYDTVSRVIGWQFRLRWILRPGNDLYVVYAQNWLDDFGNRITLDRTAATKLSYTHRF
jgi:hypothetical protein